MKITKAQARAILPAFRRAVAGLDAEWRAENEIEEILGHDFKNMHEGVSLAAFGVKDPADVEDITLDEVIGFVADLEVDG